MRSTDLMVASKQTDFFRDYRMKGTAPTMPRPEVVESLVEQMWTSSANQPVRSTEVFDFPNQERPHFISPLVCEECEEKAIEEYGHQKTWKKVCIPCAEKK